MSMTRLDPNAGISKTSRYHKFCEKLNNAVMGLNALSATNRKSISNIQSSCLAKLFIYTITIVSVTITTYLQDSLSD